MSSDKKKDYHALLALLIFVLLVGAFFLGKYTHKSGEMTVQLPAMQSSSAYVFPTGVTTSSTVKSLIPQRILNTLQKIDAGLWPPLDDSGTHGGRYWTNWRGVLPRYNDNGQRIHYREWDVNMKHKGSTRDAERIITGDDGSAYYTLDHYRTFYKIR